MEFGILTVIFIAVLAYFIGKDAKEEEDARKEILRDE